MAEHVPEHSPADDGPPGLSCGVEFVDVFKVLGKRWNGMVLVALMERPARFGELARMVSGITDAILADRLRELMAAQLVERQLAEGPGGAVRYRLTPVGEDLRRAFEELRSWAERNNVGELCRS
ncbi:helix-turn-helix transcriptional regulator [Nonomuraea sp. MG754425]|uniref:winged helix-turn-helix transcriptional regulator n=1 Tax=Nonomuraea sp. MG754425 TaxID=2570319 RepID=UPI001F3096F3|nr:helix-turn-helix domain-containing protein [Nonomuraea sp. MG754425]MCF6471507.1 helix-turn-helix transcriptional regulator [Nonomuraea sp. MG754425]